MRVQYKCVANLLTMRYINIQMKSQKYLLLLISCIKQNFGVQQ